jgi:SnoaL-like protein
MPCLSRYVWAVDSLDPDDYVAVFTEDAVIDSNGSISEGREEIRKIVTSLIQRRDDNKAKGLPASVRRDRDGRMTAAAMGRSEDRLVKRNGKWLIQWRKLTVFTD